jgi:hypothetical protein
LADSAGQFGDRAHTIITGGRKRHRPTPAEIDATADYLNAVADQLEMAGTAVDAIAIDARKPMSARLSIRSMTEKAHRSMVLCWQRGFGWSVDTRRRDDDPDGWFYLYADDAAAPTTVRDFVVTSLCPAESAAGTGHSGAGDGGQAVVPSASGFDRPVTR